ncbi:MAG: FG-GAP repeat protein [Phycisphaerae bacterium]|nr:FG-GAP repeat protein [Phycisphaerae bacterium]
MKLARLRLRSRSVSLLLVGGFVVAALIGCLPGGGQVSPGGNQAPSVVIEAPTLDVDVRRGQEVIVSYDVTDRDGDAITLSLYYDLDGVADTNDEVLVATGLTTGRTYYTLNTASIPSGRYRILLEALDNRGGRTVRYAQGAINLSNALIVAFQSPLTDIRVGSGATVSIRFTSNETVNYVLFYDENGTENGNEKTIATGSGQNVTQSWSLANIAPDTYYIGVRIRDGLGFTDTVYASGRIILDEPPSVQASSPSTDTEVYAGESVEVKYIVSDPDSDARVTIFIDVDRVFGNGNETTIATGINEVEGTATYSLDTTTITPGPYYVGVSATDGISDDVYDYASGRVVVFDTALNIQFIQPASDISVGIGDTFSISWQVNAPADGGTLDLVYVELDGTGTPVGAEKTILNNVSLAPNATTFDTNVQDVEEGKTYRLRIRATPNFGAEVLQEGPEFLIKSEPGFTLVEPDTNQTVGTGDRLYIEWEVSNLEGPLAQISAQVLLDPDIVPRSGNEVNVTPVAIALTGTAGTYRFSTTLDLQAIAVPVGDYFLFLGVNDGGTEYGAYGGVGAGVIQPLAEPATKVIISVKPRVTGTFWMGDAGRDLNGDGKRDSLVLIGFDFYDSAGSLVAPLGDFNNDGFGDFLVVAQFAKPFRTAPVGDAYVILGNGTRFAASIAAANESLDPNVAILNLNSVASTIPGQLYLGPDQVDVPDNPSQGIQSATFLPDLTGDGFGEIAFGMPYIHNSQSLTVRTDDNRYPTTIVRAGQLRRGGVIISTSANQTPIVSLDKIGQVYSPHVIPQPAAEEVNREGGDSAADPEVHRVRLTSPTTGWSHPSSEDQADNDMAGPRPVPDLGVGVLSDYADDAANEFYWHTVLNDDVIGGLLVDGNGNNSFQDGLPNDRCLFTGFLTGEQSSSYGTRVVGDFQDSKFGSWIDWWRQGIVTSSPDVDPADLTGVVPSRASAGVVYYSHAVFNAAVKPSNFVIANPGAFGHPAVGYSALIVGPAAGALLGPVASLGEAATGRGGDFNGDGLDDLAMGAPGFNAGAGAAYIFYVRLPEPFVFDLAALNEVNNDPARRAGIQINGNAGDGLGSVTPDGLDVNGDGFADAVFGNPDAGGGQGQVVLIYGGIQLASTGAGWSLNDVAYGPGIVAPGDPNKALGAIFEGVSVGDMAGSAAASVGDFDGDGLEDMIIAAPDATPRFDSDGDGILDTDGVDRDGDGVADDVDGDGNPDALTNAGVVYLVYGQRNVDSGRVKPFTGYINLSKVVTGDIPGAVFVGKTTGDQLGGGMTTPDGVTAGTRALGFATAGDVDGDGLGDILISSVRASPLGHTYAGEVYLIFGTQP